MLGLLGRSIFWFCDHKAWFNELISWIFNTLPNLCDFFLREWGIEINIMCRSTENSRKSKKIMMRNTCIKFRLCTWKRKVEKKYMKMAGCERLLVEGCTQQLYITINHYILLTPMPHNFSFEFRALFLSFF